MKHFNKIFQERKFFYILQKSKEIRDLPSFRKLSMNANIMKTQISHKMNNNLKGHVRSNSTLQLGLNLPLYFYIYCVKFDTLRGLT